MSVEAEREEAERQLERRAIDIVDRYAGSLKRSKGENDARKSDRDKIETMGRNPKAFQHAVMLARTMSRRDAEAYLEDLAWFAQILLGRQGDLFSDELERINKREQKKAAAENAPGGRTQAELDANTDGSTRSAPEAGGAKPQVPVDNAAEQKAGEDALAAMAPQTQKAKAAAKPKSQSQQAAEKREAAAATAAAKGQGPAPGQLRLDEAASAGA